MSLIIGIDPDVEKSGVATYNKVSNEFTVQKLSFFQLYEYLNNNKENIFRVKIEAGWLNNKSNFRTVIQPKKYYSYQDVLKEVNIASKIAKNIGENLNTGKKIVEACEHLNLSYTEKKPLKLIWKGAKGKITHKELELNLNRLNIPFKKSSNQDERDAILICLY